MGITVEIESLEEMCDLMCDNKLPARKEADKMYECFHCLSRAVIWDADFDFEDYGFEGQGIIHECHCTHCGARITYAISCDDEDEEEE